MEMEESKEVKKSSKVYDWGGFYDRTYKILLVISLLILFLSIVYIGYFYSQHKDIMKKDISLTGGTTITVYADINIDKIKSEFPDTQLRQLNDLTTGKSIGFVLETEKDSEETKKQLESFLGFELTDKNSSIEFTGAALSASFYKELIYALIISFIFMSLVVFLVFKSPIPSLIVILAALTDIVASLAVVNMIGLSISAAGIAAFLMLIGYSVDTDILLTTWALKRKELALNARIRRAFTTAIMMTLTAIAATFSAFLIVARISPVLREIFLILTIGLFFDILSTWLGNASLVKWYCEKKNI